MSSPPGGGSVIEAVPKDALAASPVGPAAGVPLATDAGHLWMSDFDQIGEYSLRDRAWRTVELPWPAERIFELHLAEAQGELRGLALLCESACLELDDGPRSVGLAAMRLERSSGAGRLEVAAIDVPADPLDAVGDVAVIARGGPTVLLTLELEHGGVLVEIGHDQVEVERYDRALDALCPAPGGYVGFEVVDAAEEGAVAWSPLPPGWTPDRSNAERFVAGPSPGEMAPAPLPEEVVPVLADWVGQATVCIPGGLALVGGTSAWEYVGGAWRQRPSTLGEHILNEETGAARRLPGGALVGRAASGLVQRDSDGSWRSLPADPIPVAVGDLTLSYARPRASNPPNATEGAP